MTIMYDDQDPAEVPRQAIHQKAIELADLVDYQIQDLDLLTAALTHASSVSTRVESNERLEFLGDAILGLFVCEMLYREYPDLMEGELTRIKSVVVSRATCAKITGQLRLHHYLILGKGMAPHDRLPESLLADVFESLVAAYYLDGGAEVARKFIERYIGPEIDSVVAGTSGENYKSRLQQLVQRQTGETPAYVLMEEKGPDHMKMFRIAARVGGTTYEGKWGTSKKEAEQSAAKRALKALYDDAEPTNDL